MDEMDNDYTPKKWSDEFTDMTESELRQWGRKNNENRKALFENISITFSENNRYGLIGANGSGKSTFMKILANELEQSSGTVQIDKSKRMAILKQDQFAPMRISQQIVIVFAAINISVS